MCNVMRTALMVGQEDCTGQKSLTAGHVNFCQLDNVKSTAYAATDPDFS